MSLPFVTFYTVSTPHDKLMAICQIARDLFAKGKPLLILAENEQVIDFIDTLLWKAPKESFLPHSKTDDTDSIFISSSLRSSTHKHVLNLSSKPLGADLGIKQVYELEDLTSAEKALSSKERFDYYKEKNYPISQTSASSVY